MCASAATTPAYPAPEDPAALAAAPAPPLSGSASPFTYPEQLAMLPLPESPVPGDGKLHLAAPRHHARQPAAAAAMQGPGPLLAASPLAQAPLLAPAEAAPLRDPKGKLRAD